MYSNYLPPRHHHYPPRHPSAHDHHCHHQHRITTTAIITAATLHAMPWSSTSPGLKVTGRKHVLRYKGNLGPKKAGFVWEVYPNLTPPLSTYAYIRGYVHIFTVLVLNPSRRLMTAPALLIFVSCPVPGRNPMGTQK